MSNESENKRIDLTQFEGMTKGPWHFAGPFGGMMLVTAYPHDMIVRQNGEGDCRLRLGEINSPYDGEAIAQLPDLIAELKRCYDFIESRGLDEDIEHKLVIDLRECSIELLDELCFQAGVETGTKEEMIARLLE